MRRVMIFLLFVFVLPAVADSECPIGYTLAKYTQLEYIASTGTQYIDIPFTFDNTDEMYAEVAMMETIGSDDKYFIASTSWNTNDNRFALGGFHRSGQHLPGFHFGYGNYSTGGTVYIAQADNNFHTYHYTNKTFSMVDLSITRDVTDVLWGGETTNLRLFYGYDSPTKCKIKNIWHKRSNEYLYNFIPAKRLSDNAIGMYDTVTNTFFENAGPGAFFAGPVKETEFMNSNMCTPCPPNTYKDFVGNSECMPCPDAMVSPSGSKSATDCGRALWIGDKVLFMSSAPRTTTTLNVMDSDGNIFYGNLYSEK